MRALAALLLLGAAPAVPQAWMAPEPPYRIAGNVYYVGSKGLAAYLIVGERGAVLLDGTLAENVPQIERNIAALGFHLRDVKVLLNGHAHFDHAAGLAQLRRDTGAKLLASAGDRPALESGIPPSEVSYGVVSFPAVPVARTLRDGETVRLGEIALTAILTPGHTPGCTTWRTTVREGGRTFRVLFPCSLTVAGNKLIGNKGYPAIVADFRRSFARLRGEDADIVLPAHPELVELHARKSLKDAGHADAFLMPGVASRLVVDAERAFDAELARARP